MAAQQNDLSLIHSHLFLAFSDCLLFSLRIQNFSSSLAAPKKRNTRIIPFFFLSTLLSAIVLHFFRPRSDTFRLNPLPRRGKGINRKGPARGQESPPKGGFKGIDFFLFYYRESLAPKPRIGNQGKRPRMHTHTSFYRSLRDGTHTKKEDTPDDKGKEVFFFYYFFYFYGMALKEGRWES